MPKCPKCPFEYEQDRDYRVHAIEKHGAPKEILQGDKNLITPPPGAKVIPTPAPTEIKEFDEQPHYEPVTQRPGKEPILAVPQAPQSVKEKADPLQLTWKWEGDCPICKQPVTTMIVELEKEKIAVATCLQCKKAIANKKVKPL